MLWVKARLGTRMAFCAHRARIIYHDSSRNAASGFIFNANLPADHANVAQQLDREGANCAEMAHSNMRAYNYILGMCEGSFAYRFHCFSEVMDHYELVYMQCPQPELPIFIPFFMIPP